jgi:hypothetical protein
MYLVSTSTLANDEGDEDNNDENSPIKSASYMDELRQRLERVLNDPPSPIPSSSSPASSHQSSNPTDRHSCLPISKSFRLPTQSVPSLIQSSISYHPTPISRVPLKSSQTQASHPIPSSTKAVIRGPTLITPPKLKSPTMPQCLSSTENLRTANHNHHYHQTPPMTVGSTPLPRKQLQPFHIPDRNLSYRTPNTYGHQYQFTNGNHHQMSKSFIMPSKREGIFY